jgi:CheY-like chemotaxis protein
MRNIKSILLVDDDKDDQYFFYTALEEVDPAMHLIAAADGMEAFDKLNFSQPDLILLDLVMPRMNGITFLSKIKKNRVLHDIPVIVYTTDLSIFKEKELLNSGAEEIIIKPSDYSGTVETIRNLLDKWSLKMTA